VKEIKLTDTPFLPNDQIFFGDYNNIEAIDGVVRPTWTRLDNRQLSVWISIVESGIIENPKNTELSATYKNGVLQLSHSKKIKAQIEITDLNGEVIKGWEKEKLGNQAKTLTVDLPKGVYLVDAIGKNSSWQRQIVVK
jgi:hypothetical protein